MIEPIEQVEKKVFTQQEFMKMYNDLCATTGWQLVSRPTFKPMADLGGSLITVDIAVVPFRKTRI